MLPYAPHVFRMVCLNPDSPLNDPAYLGIPFPKIEKKLRRLRLSRTEIHRLAVDALAVEFGPYLSFPSNGKRKGVAVYQRLSLTGDEKLWNKNLDIYPTYCLTALTAKDQEQRFTFESLHTVTVMNQAINTLKTAVERFLAGKYTLNDFPRQTVIISDPARLAALKWPIERVNKMVALCQNENRIPRLLSQGDDFQMLMDIFEKHLCVNSALPPTRLHPARPGSLPFSVPKLATPGAKGPTVA